MLKKFFNLIFSPIYRSIVQQLRVDYYTHDLIRLGKPNDGGYVVLKSSLDKYSNLISFGIAGDVSFEKDFQLHSDCNITCFDPSIDGLPEIVKSTTFFKLGIDSHNHGEYVNLKKALELSKLKTESKIFMKMDIEGFEWKVLGDLNSFDLLKNIDQIVIELHIKYLLGKSKFWLPIELIKRYFILKKLKKYFYFYNINANNVCGYIHFSSFIFPNVVEVSMVNKNFNNNFLSLLNQPSDPTIQDIQRFY
jgi:hypothetical protein